MNREIPVRFFKGEGVWFPSATRLVKVCRTEEVEAVLNRLKGSRPSAVLGDESPADLGRTPTGAVGVSGLLSRWECLPAVCEDRALRVEPVES